MLNSLTETFQSLPLFELVKNGGPVVAILILLSIFATAAILLKILQFLWLGIGRSRNTDKAVTLWLAGKRQTAYDLVKNCNNPVDKTLAHAMRGIEKASVSDPQVREDIERIALKELDTIRSYFRAIEAVVQIAPLLGLFGTVIGMIDAFHTLQGAGAEADPSILAGGIWVALLTTAVGLAVAIPAALILYWFEGIAEKEHHRMRGAIMSLLTGRITDGGYPADQSPISGMGETLENKFQGRAA